MTLDLLPTFVMAVLASWLGLSLLARSPRDPAAQTFGWLCFNLTLYALSITLAEMSASATVRAAAERLQVVETVVLPPVWLHFISVVTQERQTRLLQRSTLLGAYAVGTAMAVYALVAPMQVLPGGQLSFPPGLLTAIWTLHRALPL